MSLLVETKQPFGAVAVATNLHQPSKAMTLQEMYDRAEDISEATIDRRSTEAERRELHTLFEDIAYEEESRRITRDLKESRAIWNS